MQSDTALVSCVLAFFQGLLTLQSHCIALPLQHIQSCTESEAKNLLTSQPTPTDQLRYPTLTASFLLHFLAAVSAAFLNCSRAGRNAATLVFLQLLCSNLQGQTNLKILLKHSKVLQFSWTAGKASMRVRIKEKSYEYRKSILLK